ncbi:hexapeptide repeat-containing transferase [Caballeronia arvi]|uniref:Acetyltransferase n=1 Tax=Caballeronia arvi TaxID=1777135 RepID=A0A158JS64_9BURK|nr:sugar O-acetyltransferase [Caballeronia arvi]SAL71712.1 hexapeptide repeat-containing transferase [Caballeronia arvi]
MNLEELRTLMLSGKVYNDLDPELIAARARTVALTDDYNRLPTDDAAGRMKILRSLLASVGESAFFEPTLRCEFGFHVKVGERFYANFDCVLLDGGGIEIGDDVLFGPRVSVFTTNHSLDPTERRNGACIAKPVKIGSAVWLGGGVHVTPGVEIGDGVVVGAGSVVTRNLPSNTLAAGVPCRVIREITLRDKLGFQA